MAKQMRFGRYILLLVMVSLVACHNGGSRLERMSEDKVAKDLFQGVWIDDSTDMPMIMVLGDTLRYADQHATPVLFKIIRDSLYLLGDDTLSYKIVRQGETVFWLNTATDELMKLHRSDYEEDRFAFSQEQEPVEANVIQEYLEKDSIIVYDDTRYRGYVFINPTKYKVVRTLFDENGMGIESVYYDNIIHICVYNGAQELFGKDINKQFFKDYIDAEELAITILSDMDFIGVDASGYHYLAILTIPESSASHNFNLIISPQGELQIIAE
jgi:hypothetical protein